ncbi:MAG: CvpA family protein [Clostridiales bacterium]|nr:CvpA family protein [Clostridiales bacterium]
MAYAVDIILVALVLFLIVRSSKKGFVRVIINIVVWIASCSLAVSFALPLAEKVYDTFAKERMVKMIEERAPGVKEAENAAEEVKAVVSEIPSFFVSAAEAVGIDVNELSESAGSLKPEEGSVSEQLEEKVARPVMVAGLRVLSVIFIFCTVSGLLTLVLTKIAGVMKLPILKQVNKGLGAVLGAIEGVIMVTVLCFLLDIMMKMAGDGAFSDAVAASKIVKFVTDVSVLKNYFG